MDTEHEFTPADYLRAAEDALTTRAVTPATRFAQRDELLQVAIAHASTGLLKVGFILLQSADEASTAKQAPGQPITEAGSKATTAEHAYDGSDPLS